MKLRKILSLVLVAALLCTVCFIGSVSAEATAVVKQEGNYLLNGSFELVETKDEGNMYGYESWCTNHGATGTVVDYWKTFNWLNGNSAANPNIKITHTTDAHSGDYALYYDIPYNNDHTTYPSALAVDELPAGNYRLTAWVKGTNSASTINVTEADGTVKSVNVAASDDWTQISIDGITSIGNTTVNGKDVIGITIKPKKGDSASYFIIDDICLEAVSALESEYITNGGLETADKLWNNATNKEGDTGYTGKDPQKNQNNLIVDGWRAWGWGDTAAKRVTFDHTTDSHSGNYAIRVNSQVGDDNITISPDLESLNTAAIKEGYYTFSAWIKSTNTKSTSVLSANFTNQSGTAQVKTTQITAGEEWHKVSLYDIYLTDNAANLKVLSTNKENSYDLKLRIYADTVDTYVIIDDIALTKQEPFYNGGMEINGTGTSNVVVNGQANPNTILQGYTIQDWSNKKHTYDIVTDAYSGNQAIKVTNGGSNESAFVYDRHNGNDIGAGTYKFSAWAKGNATNAWLKAYQASVDTPTKEVDWLKNKLVLNNLSETEWKYYEYIFTIEEGYMIKKSLEEKKIEYFNSGLGFGIGSGTEGDFVIFDDVKLEKINGDINAAKASVLGIAAPEKGATKLTLPDVGDCFDVSIVASSDEALIALDGTITPPTHRTKADITLRISEKDNAESFVDLEPIGVVVPGFEQTQIDAVKYAIQLIPNNQGTNKLLPIHYDAAVNARAAYDALSEDAKAFVTNYVTLNERDGVLNQYGSVVKTTSLKNSKLRIKSAYPTVSAEGYAIKEYGMLFIPAAIAENEDITLDTAYVAKSVMTELPGEADADFYSILNGSELKPDVEILMRSYVTYEYGNGETITLYGRNTVKSAAGAIAQ